MKQQEYIIKYRTKKRSRTSNMSGPIPTSVMKKATLSSLDSPKERVYYYGSKKQKSSLYNVIIATLVFVIPVLVLLIMSKYPIGGIVAAILGVLLLGTCFILWLFDIKVFAGTKSFLNQLRLEFDLWRERKI